MGKKWLKTTGNLEKQARQVLAGDQWEKGKEKKGKVPQGFLPQGWKKIPITFS